MDIADGLQDFFTSGVGLFLLVAAGVVLVSRHRPFWLLMSLKGRIGRRSYLPPRLALVVIAAALLWGLTEAWSGIEDGRAFATVMFALGLLLDVIVTWAIIALDVKRLHDIGHTGWWAIPGLIPVLGLVALFVPLFLFPGEQGHNRFGEDPAAPRIHAHVPADKPNDRRLHAIFGD